MNEEIIYLYDPLCGWCYGFSQVILQWQSQIGEAIPFTVLAGGMIVGERVGPIGEVAPYIKTAYKRVEELSCVRFGEPFLIMLQSGGTTVFNSEPPSRAAYILKDAFPQAALEIAHAVQAIIYSAGLDPNRSASYHELARKLGMVASEFDKHFESHTFRLATQDEFTLVGRFGISGFPTVVYRNQDQYYLVSNGFTTLDVLNNTLLAIKKTIAEN